MTAIAIRAPGGPEMLVPEQRPVPQPGEGEVLVKVAAAGVNRPDVMQRQGLYPPPKGATDIPGSRDRRRGGRARSRRHALEARRPGDGAGGRRRLRRILPRAREPLPAGPAGTVDDRSGGDPGDLLHGLAQRVRARHGSRPARRCWCMAARPASAPPRSSSRTAFGARVITTAGSAEKCEACRKLGADVAINYKTEDFVAATKAATGGKGADVILDMVGGDYIERNYEAAAVEGRDRADRLPGLAEGDRRFPPHHAQAADPHRLDAALAAGRRQGRDRARRRAARAAADRGRAG